MVSLGTFAARALSMAVRNRAFPSGSEPPLAAVETSLSALVQPLDFLASVSALVCLILDQRLCPDMPSTPRELGITRGFATQGWLDYRLGVAARLLVLAVVAG